jgi:alpha,alpha-trehalase
MSRFPPIADYAFLSDCEADALVAADGSVEWLCLPRPDSPSVFGALLDRSAGSFRFGPSHTLVPDHRRYLPGTNIVETTWHTPTGWLTVYDLLVIAPTEDRPRDESRRRAPADESATGTLLRIANCFAGRVEVQIDCFPLFDYGRQEGQWSYPDEDYHRAKVTGGGLTIDVTSDARLDLTGARAFGQTTLAEGESTFIALSWVGDAPADQAEAQAALESTTKFWRNWLDRGKFPDHPWRPYIERSALALKGLSYQPTGAIMAASTTSLPESPGGERNWDYRYTWIRDSGFMLRALHDLGFDWEAFEYFAFILDAVRRDSDGAMDLQIMYGIGGERDLTEQTLDHLSGYIDSKPVRIGNGAWDQHQHDVWGMLLDTVASHIHRGGEIGPETWKGVVAMVDEAIDRYKEPDQGLWEMRGPPRDFVESKMMCWVAADRGAQLARSRGDDELADRWTEAAQRMHDEICDKGVDDRGVFRQHYETTELDASNLLIPILGFLPPDDDRVRATVLATADELTQDDLVLRYKVGETDDGLSGEEGTFTICSFWLVSALTMIGETDRARALFQKLLSFAGPLLLYSEEIDTKAARHLGNYPQAFTHLALIDAATRLIAVESET